MSMEYKDPTEVGLNSPEGGEYRVSMTDKIKKRAAEYSEAAKDILTSPQAKILGLMIGLAALSYVLQTVTPGIQATLAGSIHPGSVDLIHQALQNHIANPAILEAFKHDQIVQAQTLHASNPVHVFSTNGTDNYPGPGVQPGNVDHVVHIKPTTHEIFPGHQTYEKNSGVDINPFNKQTVDKGIVQNTAVKPGGHPLGQDLGKPVDKVNVSKGTGIVNKDSTGSDLSNRMNTGRGAETGVDASNRFNNVRTGSGKPVDLSEHIGKTPKDLSEHISRTPKDLSEHISSTPKDLSEHIGKTPKDLSGHIGGAPKDLSEHVSKKPTRLGGVLNHVAKALGKGKA